MVPVTQALFQKVIEEATETENDPPLINKWLIVLLITDMYNSILTIWY